MKYTVLKCDCCKRTFFSEYWEGGYIDHVVNFAEHRNIFGSRDDVRDMARKIIFDGNNVREIRHIKEFMKCFMTWDCFSDDFKVQVKRIVDNMLKELKKARTRADRLIAKKTPLVLAIVREEYDDGAFFDLFDDCCKEVK